jgi:hypothetical protein
MAHNIRPVAVGTMQHLRNHGIPIQSWSLSYSNRGYQINRSATPSSPLVRIGDALSRKAMGPLAKPGWPVRVACDRYHKVVSPCGDVTNMSNKPFLTGAGGQQRREGPPILGHRQQQCLVTAAVGEICLDIGMKSAASRIWCSVHGRTPCVRGDTACLTGRSHSILGMGMGYHPQKEYAEKCSPRHVSRLLPSRTRAITALNSASFQAKGSEEFSRRDSLQKNPKQCTYLSGKMGF